MTLDTQLKTMIIMILGGFYLGASLDTFRRFSPYWQKKMIWKYVLECLFWVIQTFILFYALYLVNSGELRLYIFAACLLGFATYKALVASFYKKMLEKLIQVCKAVFRFLAKLFDYVLFRPVKWIVLTLLAVILFFVRVIMTIVLFLLQPFSKLVRFSAKKVYQKLPISISKKINYKFANICGIIGNTFKKWINFLTF